MTITFPRDLPALGVSSCQFTLQRTDFASPEVGGKLGGVQAGLPLWVMLITAAPRTEIESEIWSAWLSGQRGGINLFRGGLITRPYPLSLPKGFPGSADCGGWSVSTDRDVLTLTGCPTGLTRLDVGDYVGFRYGSTSRTVVKVLEAATVTGTDAAFAIDPPLPSFITSATAHLDSPRCIMRMDATQSTEGPMGLTRTKAFTIRGVQDLSV